MRRLAPLALCLVLLPPLSAGCNVGGRDAHDVAADFEGPVSAGMVERLVRDVDLERAPLDISMGREVDEHFGAGDQPAFESFLRRVADELAGDQVRVTQQVVDETGPNSQRLTLTLALEHGGETRYVPVTLDLVREGRRVLVARARVMGSGRMARQ
jgi:hypothetical protein